MVNPMGLLHRCASCKSMWVDWNIKLRTVETVYAHDCQNCGEVHLTQRRVVRGVPRWMLYLKRKLKHSHREGQLSS